MELFETEDHYILLDGEHSLWCNRTDATLTAKHGSSLASAWNPICLGQVFGVVGKVRISADSVKLLLIHQTSFVGCLPGGHTVYGINRVAMLPLSTRETPELGIEHCKQHHFGISKTDKISVSPENPPKAAALPLQKTWNSIKTATSQVKSKKQPESKDRDKFDKRITDELSKMFTDTTSFFFSSSGDLTNSTQRLCEQARQNKVSGKPLWQRADERFFWNRHMLQELIDSEEPLSDHWIVPVIQGYVHIENCHLDLSDANTQQNEDSQLDYRLRQIGITLISRRSRYRAGTRYRRRGVDKAGKVANYVESEQIVEYERHTLSFVQVRGSVPVYWSQPGYKYRPPPRLDQGEEETQIAFEKHFQEELSIYDSQVIINLVEKCGKEKIIGDAYFNHVLNYNTSRLTYIIFDFHEYCRGMRFENVSVLLGSIQDVVRDMMYCWMDKEGVICEQKGVIRVNCIDCLDRTNVVQTALAKAVTEIQFSKLGLVPPEGTLPVGIRNLLQGMWANNGDCLSKQYAGTAALKGDYTRTGERRLAGMMKDGYNSANRYYRNVFRDAFRQASINIMVGEPIAEDLMNEIERLELNWHRALVPARDLPTSATFYLNDLPLGPEVHLLTAALALSRYYLNRFKDANRQVAIDLMLGNPVSEEELGMSPDRENMENDPNWILSQSEHIKMLIDDCKKILVSGSEVIMGGWALIDADPETGDPSTQDADTILVLTEDAYYVAEYDDNTDQITRYQKVMLEELEKIELGPEPSLFKSKFHCIRLNYLVNGQGGYFHAFRSTNVRFFNNMAIIIRTDDEAVESLKAICDTFSVALDVLHTHTSHTCPFVQGKLDRKRSKMPFSHGRVPNPFGGFYLELPSLSNIPRNVSEGQLTAFKNAGSKAISNMTSTFAKLNPMSMRNNLRKKESTDSRDESKPATTTAPAALPTAASEDDSTVETRATFQVASSSSEEDEEEEDSNGVAAINDVVLPSCGIITAASRGAAAAATTKTAVTTLESVPKIATPAAVDGANPRGASTEASPSRVDAIRNMHLNINSDTSNTTIVIATIDRDRPRTPEIHVSREDEPEVAAGVREMPPATLQKKLSHSSNSIERWQSSKESSATTVTSSASPHVDSLEVGVPMKTSHSEGAIREFQVMADGTVSPLASPAVTPRADAVMAPFSMLAKGVQSLGANLQRATSVSRHGRTPTGSGGGPELHAAFQDDSYEKQKQRRRNCVTRIIEL